MGIASQSSGGTPPVNPEGGAPPVNPEGGAHPVNPGIAFDADRVAAVAVDAAVIEADAAKITADALRGAPEAWLVRAISCIDLTTLAGDDTAARVRALCARARQPLGPVRAAALGQPGLSVAAVCVYHQMIAPALEALEGSGIPVAVVSAGFPAGLSPLRARLVEIEDSLAAGAREIDIVIPRHLALSGDWQALYDEIRAMRDACGAAHMKTILSTGELGNPQTVARAALVAMMAGSDFIKTSTGKEAVNATLPVSLVMARAIRDYRAATGHVVGFKPAGGISKAEDALRYLALMQTELGEDWLQPGLFRLGASSLLGDIDRVLGA